MRFDHSSNFDHRLQTAPRDPAQEKLPVPLRNASVGVGPEPICRLLDPPGSGRFQVQSCQAQKGSFVFLLIPGFGPKPVVSGSGQRAHSQSTHFAVLYGSTLWSGQPTLDSSFHDSRSLALGDLHMFRNIFLIVAILSHNMVIASNREVNRPLGSAHGTWAWRIPWFGQSTRGTPASIMVTYPQVSRCLHFRCR